MSPGHTLSFGRGAFRLAGAFAVLCLVILTGTHPAAAAGQGVAQPRAVVVPGFWDPRRRPERPDLSRIGTIRFLTDLDYPPFDYPGPDGNPAGFNVDLARADLRRDQSQLHHPGAAVREPA